jgi:hypothetical protein
MIRRLVGLFVISAALMLGLNAGTASAANGSPFIPVQCQAANLAANVSNLGVGYVFAGKCSPPHRFMVEVQWYDAAGNVLGNGSYQHPKRLIETWSTYESTVQRYFTTQQTSYACIWVTQEVPVFYGGPLLAAGCFPRNS